MYLLVSSPHIISCTIRPHPQSRVFVSHLVGKTEIGDDTDWSRSLPRTTSAYSACRRPDAVNSDRRRCRPQSHLALPSHADFIPLYPAASLRRGGPRHRIRDTPPSTWPKCLHSLPHRPQPLTSLASDPHGLYPRSRKTRINDARSDLHAFWSWRKSTGQTAGTKEGLGPPARCTMRIRRRCLPCPADRLVQLSLKAERRHSRSTSSTTPRSRGRKPLDRANAHWAWPWTACRNAWRRPQKLP